MTKEQYTNTALVIHWYRQDLRVSDNPALSEAAKHGTVIPIYILDDINSGNYAIGSAGRCWLHHSLVALNKQLNQRLMVFRGDAVDILRSLCTQHNVKAVFWNRCYEPWRIRRDKAIKKMLRAMNVQATSYNGSLLWEPLHNLKADGSPYKVFTTFYKKGCLSSTAPIRPPLPKPPSLKLANESISEVTIDDLQLLPHKNWHSKFQTHWSTGEAGAQQTLETFIAESINRYKDGRDFPSANAVSRLSPYLHWGEISPHQLWYRISLHTDNEHIEHVKRQLAWREFSYSLLFHFPTLVEKNLQTKFDAFPWQEHPQLLKRWQQGVTGYPIVDAGMRELWQTGYMHNRVRMIVGSFLVKNLLIHWRHGMQWFWDCLLDADLANNSVSWQWVAGCGCDAAPYFRIFNPVTQGEKFDPEGIYTRQYVPELSRLDNKYLFKPWSAPASVLARAGVRLGQDYPLPIVDLKTSRDHALSAFKSLSSDKTPHIAI